MIIRFLLKKPVGQPAGCFKLANLVLCKSSGGYFIGALCELTISMFCCFWEHNRSDNGVNICHAIR